jgi:prepilin-type N-terminal cleavage/methylation domain-containing protein/prepilin-type processing-associated H-X9-DG protein
MIRPAPRFCRSAFTLVELLVVIAIIAVLAALAIPFVQGAINRSQGAKSLANLKEIGRTTLTWAGENNGRFPLTSDSSTNRWFLVLEKDVLGWKRGPGFNAVPPMFRCPVLKRKLPPGQQHQPTPDYAANTWVLTQADGLRPSLNHPWPPFADQRGRALSSLLVRQPSKTIMFTTGSNWLIDVLFPTGGGNETNIYTGLQSGEAFGAVFCDGHVELIPRARIFEDADKMANRRALFDPFYQAP